MPAAICWDFFFSFYFFKNCNTKLQLDKRKYAKYRNPIVLADFVENTVSSSNEKFYLFIDEVQFCYSVPDSDNTGFEITVYDMLNELKDYKNLDVYVTGSGPTPVF